MAKSRRRNKTNARVPASNTNAPLLVEPMPLPGNGEAATVEPVGVIPVAETPVVMPVTETVVIVQPAPTLRSLADEITLERAIYVLLFLVALFVRFVQLDARPLAPSEAQTAAAAFEFLNGKAVFAYTSPLLFSLDWLTFLLLGAFDQTARLLPALLGTSLVLLPVLARNAIGRTAAIIAALLIGFSPTIVFFARTVSGADLAVGGGLAALLFFWKFRELNQTRWFYGAAVLAALALTADSAAYTILVAGAAYFAVEWFLSRRDAPNQELAQAEQEQSLLKNPVLRIAVVFAVVYLLSATTFFLNRDGLGVAFNLLGTWLSAFSTIGPITSPLNLLLVYEPLSLIFGLAGVVLALTLRGNEGRGLGLLRLLSIVSIMGFVWYTLAGDKSAVAVVAVTLPLTLLTGWFIGNLLERASEDVRTTGGWKTILTGELPIFLMFIVLSALLYLQAAAFVQQTRFSSALDNIASLMGGGGDPTLTAAALALIVVFFFLVVVFGALSVLLVGVARTTTLLAVLILFLISLGSLRTMWLLNFEPADPLPELAAPNQSALQVRDLVSDLEWISEWRDGDQRIIHVSADPALGSTGRWYLRNFKNLLWSAKPDTNALEAALTIAKTPPPGNWMGQDYRTSVIWSPDSLQGTDLWKWLFFRDGGNETWNTATLWLTSTDQSNPNLQP